MCRHKKACFSIQEFWSGRETVSEPYVILGGVDGAPRFVQVSALEGVEIVTGTDPRMSAGHNTLAVMLSPKAVLGGWQKGSRLPFWCEAGRARTLGELNILAQLVGPRCPDCGAPLKIK
jgi:hypothetical protein